MKVAWVFPGQGSQYVGMGRDLEANFRGVRTAFEEASEAIHYDLWKLCLDGSESELTLTANAQPALLALSIAILRVLLAERPLTADVVAGHSLGEYSALVAAGALSLGDGVRAVRRRGELMQEAVPAGMGGMAAILGLPAKEVENVCRDVVTEFKDKGVSTSVSSANYNSPLQIVISGNTEGVERAMELSRQKGAKRAIRLAVSAPFHCPLMQPAAEGLTPFLEKLRWRAPQIPYIANVDARWHKDLEGIKERLIVQMTAPVLWEQSVKTMVSGGVALFCEIGPKNVLSRLIKQTSPESKTCSIEDTESLKSFLKTI